LGRDGELISWLNTKQVRSGVNYESKDVYSGDLVLHMRKMG